MSIGTPTIRAEIFRYKMMRSKGDQKQAEVTVSFSGCPNCGKSHSSTEISTTPFDYNIVYRRFECGPLNIVMPWEMLRKPKQVRRTVWPEVAIIHDGKVLFRSQGVKTVPPMKPYKPPVIQRFNSRILAVLSKLETPPWNPPPQEGYRTADLLKK
jgi:hypothetical protein